LAFDSIGIIHFVVENGEGSHYVTQLGDAWQQLLIASHGSEGVLAIDDDGELHVAYQVIENRPWKIGATTGETINEYIGYVQTKNGVWTEPERVTWPATSHPAITVNHGEPLIVFQTEGFKRIERLSPDYLFQREGGGGGVGFAHLKNGSWRIGTVARPEEIIIADHRSSDVFEGRIYPMVEEMYRPRLGTDKHGMPWVIWANTTRRHTYYARWLGAEFSLPAELRGGWYALSSWLAIEKAMPPAMKHFAMAAVAADRLYFTPVIVPELDAGEPKHTMFLDLLEVAEMEEVEQSLGQFEPYSGNPLLTPGAPGSWDDLNLNWPTVWEDGERYLMVYQGSGSALPGTNVVMGMAESADGIHWYRPKLNVVQIEGQPDNNCIPWIVFFCDEEEPDLQKRYKGAKSTGLWTQNLRRIYVHSPDAIHWTEGGDMVNIHCLHEANGPSFRDPYDVPERRFKAIGRTCADEGRSAGMMWSADCILWEGFEDSLDPDDPYGKPAQAWRGRYNANRYLHPHGDQRGGQIYWNTVWIEHGLYFCLYSPMTWDGGYDIALAVSRDGYNWTRVRNGEALLARQPVGALESGKLFGAYGNSQPLQFGDKLRFYYASGVSHHGTQPHGYYEGNGIGFAELRLDGWACLRLQRDRKAGFVTTIPITVPTRAWSLHLNASGLSDFDGQPALQVEVLDAQTHHPVTGFAIDDNLIAGADGVDLPVQWQGGQLGGPCQIRLRFHFRSPWAKLYAFYFMPCGS
jgi:hypothetical protein